MKITRFGNRFMELKKSDKVRQGSNAFLNDMKNAMKEHTEKEFNAKIKKIKKLGEEIKEKPTLEKIKVYKENIKEYLTYVIKYYHKLSLDYGNSQQLLIRVEIINKEIETLTSRFIEQQRATLEIASKIDEILGLLVDLYR